MKPAFSWGVQDKHVKLMNFNIEMSNIQQTKVYEISEEKNVPVIKNLFGWEGLQLKKMFTQEEKEKCRTATHEGNMQILWERAPP